MWHSMQLLFFPFASPEFSFSGKFNSCVEPSPHTHTLTLVKGSPKHQWTMELASPSKQKMAQSEVHTLMSFSILHNRHFRNNIHG